MSGIPKTVEETPAPAVEQTPVVEATDTAKPSEPAVDSEPSATMKPSEEATTTAGGDAAPVPAKEETVKADKNEAVVKATPTTEGVLGYKTPGFIPKFHFHEHYFWLDDAPSSGESLAGYIRSKDLKTAHPNTAWAQQTGKGLLFYAKRVEDKSSPIGIINLSDATVVTKEGADEFFFKAHGQKHTFQVKNAADRASWLVAIEKKIEEAKAIKDEVHNSEGYKKHLESYAKAPALGAATAAATATSREPKKSLDAAQVANVTNNTTAGVDGAAEEKKDAKSRSQSRKRSSIFGSLLGKREEKDEQKEVKKEDKAEEKAEKKAEKEAVKEEKAEEKEIKDEEKAEKKAEKEELKEEKKEEAKATFEPSTAAEAGVAAAVPAAALVADEKKHDKSEAETTTPTEKKSKRSSIFGGLFAKKDVTSPTSKKTEKEGAPAVPTKDTDVLPVSETAPKIEEPIANKPIDTAAVTAPIDTVQTPAAADTTAETPKDTAAAETSTTPTKEKKGGLIGFIKKEAAKLEGKKDAKKEDVAEKKEEKAAEAGSKDPVAAAPATESPATAEETAAPATEEARPADKRRTSLFGNLSGSVKKSTQSSDSTGDAAALEAGTKREKSPLPQRFGSLFRRPSRGVKTEEPKEAPATATDSVPATEATSALSKDETALTNGTSTEAAASTVVGDDVADNTHPTVHDTVTAAPEVKASA